MKVNKEKVLKEFEEDKSSIEAVLNQTKEVKSITKNKEGEIVSTEKKIILPNGKSLPNFYGRVLKINKKLHGSSYFAKAGTKYDDIPFDFRSKVSFFDSDFE